MSVKIEFVEGRGTPDGEGGVCPDRILINGEEVTLGIDDPPVLDCSLFGDKLTTVTLTIIPDEVVIRRKPVDA